MTDPRAPYDHTKCPGCNWVNKSHLRDCPVRARYKEIDAAAKAARSDSIPEERAGREATETAEALIPAIKHVQGLVNDERPQTDVLWALESLLKKAYQLAAQPSVQRSTKMESGDIVPTQICRHAWEVAMCLSEEVTALLSECGMKQREGHSVTTEIMAKMVQLAINRVTAERGSK